MSLFIVDAETDGPLYGVNSMFQFACIKVTHDSDTSPWFWSGLILPVSNTYEVKPYELSRVTRDEVVANGVAPEVVMGNFEAFLGEHSVGRPIFMSDNPAFDFGWINYYFWRYLGRNPFGHSGRRIGDLFAGVHRDLGYNWKRFRRTPHDHNPVNDCRGNLEALLVLREHGLKIPSR